MLIMNTMPKSASMFLSKAVQMNTEHEQVRIFTGYGLTKIIDAKKLEECYGKRFFCKQHFDATKDTLRFLDEFFDTIVVHFRDPRQATLLMCTNCVMFGPRPTLCSLSLGCGLMMAAV